MSSSLTPGPETFTPDQLHAVWLEDQRAGYRRSLYHNAEYDANHNLKYMKRFCLNLYASARDPLNHRKSIDEAFAHFQAPLRGHITADEVCMFTTMFCIISVEG